jgi:putative ABC transport system permease protein
MREPGSRLFRALLRLLPFEFRDSFGREMTHTFRDQRREAAHEGTMGIFRLWMDTVHGLLTTAPGQHAAILRQDIGYALRMMRKHPGFTAVALVTLIVAIAANTAIFSIVHAVLLKPLPYPDPDRVVLLWERNLKRSENRAFVSPPAFIDWRDEDRSAPDGAFTQLAALTETSLTLADESGRGATSIRGYSVTPAFFDVLGVSPQLGRLFSPQDEHTPDSAAPPVVISDGFWQRRFGGNPDVIGHTVQFDERTYTIAGVLPASFRFQQRGDVFLPYVFTPAETTPNMRGARFLQVIARVKPDLTIAQAQDRFSRLVASLAVQRKTSPDWTAMVRPMRDYIVGNVRTSVWLLMGAVGFVLLIACANLASLLLARTVSRREEMAVRAALGAGHARLFRQLLTESLVLGLIAGIAGTIIAGLALKPLARLAPATLPRLQDLALDWQVLAFTLGISLLTGLLFGLAPALRVSASNLFDVLRSTGRDTAGRRSRVLRDPLVAAQVGLTLVLLVGATLMARSFMALQHVSLGFNPDHVLTHFVPAPPNRYPTPDHMRAFADQIVRQMAAVPGVTAAGLDVNVPLNGADMMFGFSIPKHVPVPGERTAAQFHAIAGDYFRALGQPILRGRSFDASESATSPPVVIINETMARRYWPNSDPVGEHIRLVGHEGEVSRQIVGVVADVKHTDLVAPVLPEVYIPQVQDPWRFTHVLLRTDAAHAATLPAAVREAMTRLDPRVPLDHFVWMDDLVAASMAPVRFQMLLLAFFAVVALLLSLICIYGVMSYAVNLRVNELGVRMALGAAPRDLVWLVVREAMTPALTGIAIGLIIADTLAHLLRAQFSAIDATDPVTLGMVTLLLIGVALIACYLPARRATKVDPLITLRA